MHGTVRKDPGRLRVAPWLTDYEAARAGDPWAAARARLDGLPDGALNIAYEAVERHANGPRAGRTALRFLRRDGTVEDIAYADLHERTCRFASALAARGIRRGDVVCTLAGRIPELYVAALGALRLGAVYCPLFSAFGPEPIATRLARSQARVLVTTASLYRRRAARALATPTAVELVVLVDEPGEVADTPGTVRWDELLASGDPGHAVARTSPDDVALLHFTSGTTGMPKGALHVHGAVVGHEHTARCVLDLHDEDAYWCTADPGWVTGTSYGIVAPLVCGVTSIVDEADFDAARWYRILDEQRVSVWYTAPTAIRMLVKTGAQLARERRYPALRHLLSVGEPLAAEGVLWGIEAFGLPFHDTWWQTETGAIMVANLAACDIRPGSMGRPVPGIEVGVIRRGADGGTSLCGPDEEGELALRAGWPSMFRGYLGEPERYARAFRDGWYVTGDLARRDADGYLWFVGRADDLIKSSGHLIGPFEVESALAEHPAVAESGVIGRPDPVAGEVVKAFVVLRDGYAASPELARELVGFARGRLGAVVAPKEVELVAALPHTRSGKVMRRLLRARELGLPEGDTSTLEGAS